MDDIRIVSQVIFLIFKVSNFGHKKIAHLSSLYDRTKTIRKSSVRPLRRFREKHSFPVPHVEKLDLLPAICGNRENQGRTFSDVRQGPTQN